MVAKDTPATRCASAAQLHYRHCPISEKIDVAEQPPAFHSVRYSAYEFYASRQSRCSAHRQAAECPLWVKSGHSRRFAQCPLYPQKQTSEQMRSMSAKCQNQ